MHARRSGKIYKVIAHRARRTWYVMSSLSPAALRMVQYRKQRDDSEGQKVQRARGISSLPSFWLSFEGSDHGQISVGTESIRSTDVLPAVPHVLIEVQQGLPAITDCLHTASKRLAAEIASVSLKCSFCRETTG